MKNPDAIEVFNDQEVVAKESINTKILQSHIPEFELGLREYSELKDYVYFPTEDKYINRIHGGFVTAKAIDIQHPKIDTGKLEKYTGKKIILKASTYIAQNQRVGSITWNPREKEYILSHSVINGELRYTPGMHTYNTYRRPEFSMAALEEAPENPGPWLAHLNELYGVETEHILSWFANRVQEPENKVNHCLVLGGYQGVGKDTILEPVINAVGRLNVSDVSPGQLLDSFNPWAKSVITRISEARDMGEVNQFQFYEATKTLMAAPPDSIVVNEKYRNPYTIPNITGVIITTNNRSTGLYLPPDDRRHFVAWSNKTKEDFDTNYWRKLWDFYGNGGYEAIYKFLLEYNISTFDPKAPPPKTQSFYDMMAASQDPADAEMADALETIERPGNNKPITNPKAVTIFEIIHSNGVSKTTRDYLKQRKNSRKIPYRFEAAGYVSIRNPDAADGLWKIGKKRQVVYVKTELSQAQKLNEACKLKKLYDQYLKSR